MMKQLLRTAFCLLSGSALFACGPTKEPLTRQTLEAGFVTPPDSIQTSVYWYWMSNNLSKEGVVKDLQAMKKAGINRAFIGNIKDDSFENIMKSEKAKEVAEKVKACDRNCAFIVTERHDMIRKPWKPILWILKNKIRIAKGKDICW